jgi:glycerol-1-phosphate dehydrogenase [NAD(P)+]
MGIYVERHAFTRVKLFFSQDFDEQLVARLTRSLQLRNIQILQKTTVESISFEKVTEFFRQSSASADAIIGFGGGKALDVAKYPAFLFQLPYLSVPTSLSNDGFCSPQSSPLSATAAALCRRPCHSVSFSTRPYAWTLRKFSGIRASAI